MYGSRGVLFELYHKLFEVDKDINICITFLNYMVENVHNILIEMFISDVGYPFPNGLTPDMPGYARYSFGLGHNGFVRPHTWKNSLGYSLELSACANIEGAPRILPFPGGYQPPCIIDIARAVSVYEDPNHGPYFLHIWAWKQVSTPGTGTEPVWKPIEEEEFKVRPYFGLIDPSTGSLTQRMKPILPDPVSVYNGLGIVPLTNEMLASVWTLLRQQGAVPQLEELPGGFAIPGGTGLDLRFELPYAEITIPNIEGWKKFYNYQVPRADFVVNYLAGINTDEYAQALCGQPALYNWCNCAEMLKDTLVPSTQCGGICKCIDPIGYYIAATNNGVFPGCTVRLTHC